MKSLAKFLFKYRSYTPLPFVLVMFVFYDGNIQSWAVGSIICLFGELLRIWGVAYAGSLTRTTTSVKAKSLITGGPFAHVRNPLYIGNILIYLGFGIITFALFPYLQIVALAWFVFQYTLIIKLEEGFLEIKFGDQYSEYKKNVPRIFPKLFVFNHENEMNVKPNYLKALKSETSTLRALISIPILLFIIHMVK
ncbi:MAG: isoprenylcysteine carboxylmethyltransferase family protein [Melioribacteraceae bacterium]|nr:isoprenylcysteine carboxylmethyltransferase family protein [Melioribacteraceae bacterium]